MTTQHDSDATTRGRQLGIVLAIISASITTSLTVPPILPRMLQHFAHIPGATFWVPLVVALPPLISTFAAPLFGVFSDRVGRRQIVLFASLVSAAVGVLPFFLDSLWAILASRALIGFTTGALLVCTSAMIADFFDGKRRQDVLGAKYAVLGIAHVCVFIVVGHLAETNWRNAFWIFLWGFLAAALVALFVPRETVFSNREAAAARDAAGPALKSIPWLRFLPIFAGVYLGLTAFDVLLSGVPFLLVERGINSTRFAGFVAAVASAGMFTGSALYPFLARRVPGRALWCVTFSFAAAGYLTLGSATTAPLIFLGTYVVGSGCGLVAPNSLNLLLSGVPPRARGKIVGLQTVFFFLGLGTGPLVGVTVAKAMGSSVQLMIVISATLAALAFVYAILALTNGTRSAPLGTVQE